MGLHTGIFADDDGHHGEVLNLTSPDVIPVLRQFEQQYPLPAGHTWDGLEQRWTSQAAAGVWRLLGKSASSKKQPDLSRNASGRGHG